MNFDDWGAAVSRLKTNPVLSASAYKAIWAFYSFENVNGIAGALPDN
jgi:hypothetical protein